MNYKNCCLFFVATMPTSATRTCIELYMKHPLPQDKQYVSGKHNKRRTKTVSLSYIFVVVYRIADGIRGKGRNIYAQGQD